LSKNVNDYGKDKSFYFFLDEKVTKNQAQTMRPPALKKWRKYWQSSG